MCRDSEKHSICRVPWRMAVRATSMGRAARADNNGPFTQVVDVGILQVVDGVMYVAQALALDVQRVGRHTPVPIKMAL